MRENGNAPAPMPRMKQRYQEEVVPAMMKEFGYDNVMQVPKLKGRLRRAASIIPSPVRFARAAADLRR